MWQAFCVEQTLDTVDAATVLERLRQLSTCTPRGCHDALHLHTPPAHAMHAFLPFAFAFVVALAALASRDRNNPKA